ncbi:unnamed protein product [Linum trigynum]|uniref:Protein DGS1, mitochondrial n=2 Tax=Linum trigynum TaxID=586398 RepID=A0AAV2FZZ5_9ROSI
MPTGTETATVSEAMEDGAGKEEPQGVKSLVSFYSNYVWNRLAAFVPTDSNFLARVASIRPQKTRRRNVCLPLPLPSPPLASSPIKPHSSRVYDVLEDILEHSYNNLHSIQKNLLFWQSRAEGSDGQKLYFMLFERGPQAFVEGTAQLVRETLKDGYSTQQLALSASAFISERLAVLRTLRCALAAFLAEVYREVDKHGEELMKDPEKAFPSMLITIDSLFSHLEASIGHLHAMRETDSSVDGSYSLPLLFEKLPEVDQGSEWTDCEIIDAINVLYKNLEKLDSYLSLMVVKHQKPRKLTQHWIRYTCGAVGLSVCSIWVLRHSRLMGSSDIDNWIHEARDSVANFYVDHVEQPILSIRDDLFDTFRKRHKGVMEVEEVQLTANSLHRMLLAFSEQTKGEPFHENASDQKMLEIVMNRYEQELEHPVQNLVKGELARGLLIQVQKLKLDIETAMLELDQILKANEINFAILAALPAFGLSLLLLVLLRAWIKQDTRAEGRGRIARRYRRLLLIEVERSIMQYQDYLDHGMAPESQCMFGMVLYSLNRLCLAVEGHAMETGEWQLLRQDIVDLGKPSLTTDYKLKVTSRMERAYECLLPSTTRL